MKKNEVLIRVRFHEADPYNVAHHSCYFQWFDVGMLNFFEKVLEFGTEEMQSAGILIPIIEDHCSYSKACYFGDDIIIQTTMECDSKPTFFMHHAFINKESGDTLAKGRSRHIFASQDGKLIPRIPKVYRERLTASQQAHPEYFK